jgi:hypothetical protein
MQMHEVCIGTTQSQKTIVRVVKAIIFTISGKNNERVVVDAIHSNEESRRSAIQDDHIPEELEGLTVSDQLIIDNN